MIPRVCPRTPLPHRARTAQGDGTVDFTEFKIYWEKNIDEGGGVLNGLMNRMGSLMQTSSDLALEQVKANRAQIDALVNKWGLDKPIEAERKVNVLDKDPADLTMDDLRGESKAVLLQVLKRCKKGSREAKMVQTMIDKASGGAEVILKSGKKLDASYGKYMDMGPGAINLAIKAMEKNLKKLKKGKKNAATLQQTEATQKQLDTVKLIFAEKVQYSGILSKKGGKKGTKGIDERWFALENVDGSHWVLEYYHPKKFTLLGEIPIDEHCVIERDDKPDKDGSMQYHLDVTCTQQGRTYYMLTENKEFRDEWYKFICEDAGVSGLEHDSDDHDDEIAGDDSADDHPEEMDDGDEEGVPPAEEEEKAAPPAEEEEDDDDLE